MALQMSNKYDHIDVDNGTNTLRHYLNDNDAAAEIAKVEQVLTQETATINVSWTPGSIANNGTEINDSSLTKRIRSSYIYLGDLEDISMSIASGYKMSWITYDANKVQAGTPQDWTTTPGTVAYSPSAVYIRFVLCKGNNNDADITVVEGSNLTVTIRSKIYQNLATMNAHINEKANPDGSYSGMTVGNAEQLVSTIGLTETTPYTFRTAGGSLEIANREEDKVVGGTIVWNQMIKPMSETDRSELDKDPNSTLTKSDENNSITLNGTVVSPFYHYVIWRPKRTAWNHVCLIAITVSSNGTAAPTAVWAKANNYSTNTITKSFSGNGTYYFISKYYSSDNNIGDFILGCTFSNTSLNNDFSMTFKNIMEIDLTAMFGSTIADYIYSLEQGTVGAGVAWFRKLFPKPYYAYNAGELMSVQTSAHNMTGLNQWDEELALGTIDATTGVPATSGTDTASVNFFKILPNTTYYIHCSSFPSSLNFRARFYDKNYNYIGYSSKDQVYVHFNSSFITPDNAYYMKFTLPSEYGKTYKNDICINLSWDGERDGEYEPYKLNSYALDSDLVLRGIPKLDTNNNLYYNGDTYEADGTVTRKYGVVDLGTLNWSPVSASSYSGNYFQTVSLTNFKHPSTDQVPFNAICIPFVSAGWNVSVMESIKATYNTNQYQINVVTPRYGSMTAAQFKAAMSGVMLVYELDVSTTETADPYASTQVVDNFGTEEYVDSGNRDVSIPVGHETKYLQDLRAKLEVMPNSPDEDGEYVVRRINGTNEYVPLTHPIDDTAGTGDTNKVWSADKVSSFANELAVHNTASGAIASFPDGADGLPVKELVAQIDPVQDLHGYNKPWPAGGSKNLYDISQAYVPSGTTMTRITNGFNITATNVNYPSSRSASFTFQSGVTYTLSAHIKANSLQASYRPRICVRDQANAVKYFASLPASTSESDVSITFTPSEQINGYVSALAGGEGATVDVDYTFIQLEIGSSATSFVPYSNICPITGWTGANIARTGKNLLKNTSPTVSGNGHTFTLNNDGTVTVTGTVTGYTPYGFSLLSIFGLRNETVILNGLENVTNIVWDSIRILDSSNSTKYNLSGGGSANAQTINLANYSISNGDRLQVVVKRSTNGDVSGTIKPMIRLASVSDATFEPYTGTTYPISFGSAGTVYGGTLNVTTGVLTVDRATVDLGSLDWQVITSGLYPRFVTTGIANIIKYPATSSTVANVLTSIGYNPVSFDTIYNGNVNNAVAVTNAGSSAHGNISITDSNYSSAESFKTAMSGVQMVYELATPTTYQLTPTEVKTLLCNNNIWSDTGNVSVNYPADTKLYIDGKIAEIVAQIVNA